MKDSVYTVLTGTAGVTGIEVAPIITDQLVSAGGTWVQVLSQLAIAVVTLIGLLKKPKPTK